MQRFANIVTSIVIASIFAIVGWGIYSDVVPNLSTRVASGQPQAPVMPDQQTRFIQAFAYYAGRYSRPPNSIVQAQTIVERDNVLCQILGKEVFVDDWLGRIVDVDITRSHKGIISVSIAKDMEVQTVGTDFFGDTSNTLIPNASGLFAQMPSMEKGQLIRFGGTFISRSPTKCIDNIKLTENGDMTEMSALFRFGYIEVVR